MPHPLVLQLRFTRAEFKRAFSRVTDADARKRVSRINCISWTIGHLAWQEQRYFLFRVNGEYLMPEIQDQFANGQPSSTPPLKYTLDAWNSITRAVDPWLDAQTAKSLQKFAMWRGKPTRLMYGNLLQRVIYHYWYHTGEIVALRKVIGHSSTPQFVGNIDDQAPFQAQ